MNNDLRVRSKPVFGASDDAEDEMLNYQELFHRSNTQPSAQVIREPKTKRQQSDENEEKKKKSTNIDLTQTTVMRPVIIVRKNFFLNHENQNLQSINEVFRNEMLVQLLFNYQSLLMNHFHKQNIVVTKMILM